MKLQDLFAKLPWGNKHKVVQRMWCKLGRKYRMSPEKCREFYWDCVRVIIAERELKK